MKSLILTLALGAFPIAAVAQTTPADVLAEWAAIDDAYDSISFTYSVDTDTPEFIRLEDFVLTTSFDLGFGSFDLTVNLGWAELRANGDGTVALSEADTIVMDMAGTLEMAGINTRTEARATMLVIGASNTISGTPGAHHYAGRYDEVKISTEQTSWTGDDAPVKSSDRQVWLGMDYTTTLTGGPAGFVDFTYSIDRSEISGTTPVSGGADADLIELVMTVTDQQDEGRMNLAAFAGENFDLAALDFALNSSIGEATFLMQGAGFEADMTFGASTGSILFNGQTAGIVFEMADIAASYIFMGFPASFNFERFAFDASGPLGPRHRIGTSRLMLSFEGFTLDESLMAMMDPGAALGRGPLDLSVSFEGQTSGLFDPSALGSVDDMQPPELRSFRVDAAGAFADFNFRADGRGEMQDNLPVGTGQASVTNLNAMLERLGNAGLISTFDLSMAQGMLTMLFTPGPTPGNLQTSFEMRTDGSIWVNGQQMQ